MMIPGGFTVCTFIPMSSRCDGSPQGNFLQNVHVPRPSVYFRARVVAEPEPAIVAQVDSHAIYLRLQCGNCLSQNGSNSWYEDRLDTGVNEEVLLGTWTFGFAESRRLVGVPHC